MTDRLPPAGEGREFPLHCCYNYAHNGFSITCWSDVRLSGGFFCYKAIRVYALCDTGVLFAFPNAAWQKCILKTIIKPLICKRRLFCVDGRTKRPPRGPQAVVSKEREMSRSIEERRLGQRLAADKRFIRSVKKKQFTIGAPSETAARPFWHARSIRSIEQILDGPAGLADLRGYSCRCRRLRKISISCSG